MSIKPEAVWGPSPEMLVLLADIDAIADDAYTAVAASSAGKLTPDTVHTGQNCGPVTDIMIPALRAQGYSVPIERGERHIARVGWHYDEVGRPLPVDQQPESAMSVIHRFPVIETDSDFDNEIIADATWQQFLTDEQRTTDLPRVLAGTRGSVQLQLRFFGFDDPDLLRIWQKPERPKKPGPHVI